MKAPSLNLAGIDPAHGKSDGNGNGNGNEPNVGGRTDGGGNGGMVAGVGGSGGGSGDESPDYVGGHDAFDATLGSRRSANARPHTYRHADNYPNTVSDALEPRREQEGGYRPTDGKKSFGAMAKRVGAMLTRKTSRANDRSDAGPSFDLYLQQQQQQLSRAGRSADSLSGSSSSADSVDSDVGLTKQQQEKKKKKKKKTKMTKKIAEEKKAGEKKKTKPEKNKKKKKGVLSALHRDDGEWQEAEYSDPENNIDGSGAAYSQERMARKTSNYTVSKRRLRAAALVPRPDDEWTEESTFSAPVPPPQPTTTQILLRSLWAGRSDGGGGATESAAVAAAARAGSNEPVVAGAPGTADRKTAETAFGDGRLSPPERAAAAVRGESDDEAPAMRSFTVMVDGRGVAFDEWEV